MPKYLTDRREALEVVVKQLNAVEPGAFAIKEVEQQFGEPDLFIAHAPTATVLKVDESAQSHGLFRNASSKRYYCRVIVGVLNPDSWRGYREQPYDIRTTGSDEAGYTHTVNAKSIIKAIYGGHAKKVAHDEMNEAKQSSRASAEALIKQARALLPKSGPYEGITLANGVAVTLSSDDYGNVHVRYTLPIPGSAKDQAGLAAIIEKLSALTF